MTCVVQLGTEVLIFYPAALHLEAGCSHGCNFLGTAADILCSPDEPSIGLYSHKHRGPGKAAAEYCSLQMCKSPATGFVNCHI